MQSKNQAARRRAGRLGYFGADPAPDDARKNALTGWAKELVEKSETLPTHQLQLFIIDRAKELLGEVLKYQGWEGSTCYFSGTCYDSSQIIKSNLAQARQNANIRLGIKEGMTQGVVENVSVAVEMAKELPAAVKEQAVVVATAAIEAAEDAAEAVVDLKEKIEEAATEAAAVMTQSFNPTLPDDSKKREAEAKVAALKAKLAETTRQADEAKSKADAEEQKLKKMGIDLAAIKQRKMLMIAGAGAAVLGLGIGAYFLLK